MKRFSSRVAAASLAVLVLLGTVLAVGVLKPSLASATEPAVYSTRGVVRSFGPERRFVNIAHADIPGYMAAMTMSFEPRTASQLAGVNVNDRVVFAFTATADGRRLLNSLTRE